MRIAMSCGARDPSKDSTVKPYVMPCRGQKGRGWFPLQIWGVRQISSRVAASTQIVYLPPEYAAEISQTKSSDILCPSVLDPYSSIPVSYTHLTLPTILLV